MRVVVDNVGWLPTYISKKALEKKAVRGVVGEIELPADAQNWKAARCASRPDSWRAALTRPRRPYGWTADTTQDRAKMEWVVRARPGSVVKVQIRHERAGVVKAAITLT